nr:GLPGLI family protein [Saprospiraceae bacterium]
MLSHSLFFLIASLLGISLLAQESIIYQVEYRCETKIRKGKSHDGVNTLYFSGDRSLYIHNDFPKETKFIGGKGDPNRQTFHVIKGDSEGIPVFMNLSTDSMIYKTVYGSGSGPNFILSTQIPQINWEIYPSEKDIGGYPARLAVGEFGGRTYEAWFTEGIPVPYGPFMLNGLPGLILEAFSRDEKVHYWFMSFKQITDPEFDIAPPTDGIKVTMEQIEEIRIKSLYQAEARGATHNDPHPDWEIEKSKWTIFGDYKKNRREKRNQRR